MCLDAVGLFVILKIVDIKWLQMALNFSWGDDIFILKLEEISSEKIASGIWSILET